jgi:hypothetical protein
MATRTWRVEGPGATVAPSSREEAERIHLSEADRAVRWAYGILLFAFIVAPIVAGLDKFFHLLTDWNRYLAPTIAARLPVQPAVFMKGVGVVEVIAGLIVALRPSVGGIIVAVWLWGIVVNLVAGGFYDIALRDFGLSLGALALARLARYLHR